MKSMKFEGKSYWYDTHKMGRFTSVSVFDSRTDMIGVLEVDHSNQHAYISNLEGLDSHVNYDSVTSLKPREAVRFVLENAK